MSTINDDATEVCDMCGELLVECTCCPYCGGSGEHADERNGGKIVLCRHCGGSGEAEPLKPMF